MRRQRMPHGECARDTATSSSSLPPPTSSSRNLRLLTLIVLATSATFSFPVSAQTPATAPAPVCCMAYGIADENFLYIQGGLATVDTVRSAINQFVALDLTVDSWSTSNPPWVWLQNLGTTAPPASSWHSMTVARDRANLFMWDPYQQSVWWTYNIGQNQWYSYSNTLQTTKKAGIRNGVDMNTGYVYIPNGNNNGQEMIMNPPFTTSLTISAMPTHLMPEPVGHESFVWSTVRNTFLHYGGKSMFGTTGNPHLNEFSAARGWAAVATTGSSPGDVSGHCMVPAYAGTKMIVFGGAGLDGVAKAGIYILDVRTRQWTEGKAADLDQARTNMACAVSGDSFISWGGESNFVNKDATPIVYDMKNNQWTIQFNRVIRAGVTIDPIDPSKSDPSPGSKSGSANMAAIGGGVTCAMVVALTIVGLFLYRRRRQPKMTTMSTAAMASSKKDDDMEEGVIELNARAPLHIKGQCNAGSLTAGAGPTTALSSLPSYPLPPPLSPRPTEDRDAFISRLSAALGPIPTKPLSGPQAILNDKQGPRYTPIIDAGKSEWIGGDDYDHRGPSSQGPGHRPLHTSTRENDNSVNTRSPQIPASEAHMYRGTVIVPRNPQEPSLPVHVPVTASQDQLTQTQALSGYVDMTQHQNRTQDLQKRLNDIWAEQEQLELERSRLEQEALMQNYHRHHDPHFSSPSQH